MDRAFDLAERALNGEFPKLPKKSPAKASKNPKKPAESSKINKKALIINSCKFIQNEKQLQNLFYEINPDIKFSKTTFYSWGILNYSQKPLMTTS